MSYDFDSLPARRATNSLKWDTYPEDVLPLWVADMDFRSPEPVIQALRRVVDQGIFGYPSGVHHEADQQMALRNAIVERMQRLYQWSVQPDQIVFVPGVAVGFNLACHALASGGGNVMVQTPVYPPILQAPLNAGLTRQDLELVPSPLPQPGSFKPAWHYEIDFEEFENAINPQTRLFILCNPHNPVGRVFSRRELERLAEICLRHHVPICSDEVHGDLLFEGCQHLPMASLAAEIAANTITLMAPSKTYNLAGLQLAYAIIPNPSLRQAYIEAGKGLTSWVNSLGWVAALAAYTDGQDWLEQALAYLQRNRATLLQYLAEKMPAIIPTVPEGTYLAWLDCRPLELGASPFHFFLKEARVALNDGKTFGKGGEGFVRLNFACPHAFLLEALERMAKALASAGR